MNQIRSALLELRALDESAMEDQWVNNLHPLVKLLLTMCYIFTVVSFSKYDILGLAGMIIYPLALFLLSEQSPRRCWKRLRLVLPLVIFVGALNPLFDRVPVRLGSLVIRAGWFSMVTLMMKGSFAALASYLLIATTTMEKLCYALRLLHVPRLLVTQLMLTLRYLSLLLEETLHTTQAYALRAPGQKGIHFRAWGPLVGQQLLRSMDRSNRVYESMTLRGYRGDFDYWGCPFRREDAVFLLLWLALFALFRTLPVFVLLGGLFA